MAAGVDGVFLEVHDNPAEAKSDGANALNLKDLRGVLETLLEIQAAVFPDPITKDRRDRMRHVLYGYNREEEEE